MINLQHILIKNFNKLSALESLMWFPEQGVGFYPVQTEESPYDAGYFNRYAEMSNSEIGRNLIKVRIDVVKKYYGGEVLDVGIGCGGFIESHGNAKGYDINPTAIEWLSRRALLEDLYSGQHEAVTFWDSLEHIYDIDKVIQHVKTWAFVSIPIFDNAEHCLHSKHFRKNEHVWYFTDWGIKKWFKINGFECKEQSHIENSLGREGINTYVFRRIP